MRRNLILGGLTIALVMAVTAGAAVAAFSFGVWRDNALANRSEELFGVGTPLHASSSKQVTKMQAIDHPTSLVTLANGLHAHVVTTRGPAVIDQISLWPNATRPRWLIACNEEDASQPGLVRINVATGAVRTIVTGTESCDPTRRTPWGTILFGEENDGGPSGGQLYELIHPLETTNVHLDRSTGTFSGGTGADNLAVRPSLGRAGFEGIGILSDGTTYLDADDSGFGPKNGGPGDMYFKFVPDHPPTGPGWIDELSQSPYASGTVYGLRVGPDEEYGQGREFGFGQWLALANQSNPDLMAEGLKVGLTGYFRPEDADVDPIALRNGRVRVCSNDTGDEEQHLYGQTVCLMDGTIHAAEANTATPEIQPFVIGGTSRGVNMPDNIAFQPRTGNAIVHEDAETTFEFPHNNDLWDCLPDGGDQDLLSDGCIRIATLNDLTAEWTGGIFNASGTRLFVSVQHNISGRATVLEIDGWR